MIRPRQELKAPWQICGVVHRQSPNLLTLLKKKVLILKQVTQLQKFSPCLFFLFYLLHIECNVNDFKAGDSVAEKGVGTYLYVLGVLVNL